MTTTRSTWAFVSRRTIARAEPRGDAAEVGRVDTVSLYGAPEVVAVGDRTVGDYGEWLKIDVPEEPNDTIGWIPREAVDDPRTTDRVLTIDTSAMHAWLERDGRELWSAPIGVGRKKWPTPLGHFYVRARFFPSRLTPLYGAFSFCTSCIAPEPWPGGRYLAVHGTNRPELIPGRVSAGCIRVRDEDILALRPLLPLGGRVSIT